MKYAIFLIFLIASIRCVSQESVEIEITDENFETAIRNAFNIDSDTPILNTSMKELKEFSASENGIRDLSGLEYVTKLEELPLNQKEISPIHNLRNGHPNLYLDITLNP